MNLPNIHSTLLILILALMAAPLEKEELIISVDQMERQGAFFYYMNEPFTGTALEHFPEGGLKSTALFVNGKREGEHKGYYENGQMAFLRSYKNNKKHGKHLGWWPNGYDKFSYLFKDGLQEGESVERFEDGKLFRAMHYTKGKEDGSQKMWEADGSIRANYVVKHGRRYGLIGLKNCKSVNNEEGFTAVKY